MPPIDRNLLHPEKLYTTIAHAHQSQRVHYLPSRIIQPHIYCSFLIFGTALGAQNPATAATVMWSRQ